MNPVNSYTQNQQPYNYHNPSEPSSSHHPRQETPLNYLYEHFQNRNAEKEPFSTSNQNRLGKTTQFVDQLFDIIKEPQLAIIPKPGPIFDFIKKTYSDNIFPTCQAGQIHFHHPFWQGREVVSLGIQNSKNSPSYPIINIDVAYSAIRDAAPINQAIPLKALSRAGDVINYINPQKILTDREYLENRKNAINTYMACTSQALYPGQDSDRVDIPPHQRVIWNPQYEQIDAGAPHNKTQYQAGTENSIFSWTPTIRPVLLAPQQKVSPQSNPCANNFHISIQPPLLYDRNQFIYILKRAQNILAKIEQLKPLFNSFNTIQKEWLENTNIEPSINLEVNDKEWNQLIDQISKLDSIKAFDIALELSSVCQAYIQNMDETQYKIETLCEHAKRKKNSTPPDVLQKLNKEITEYKQWADRLKKTFTTLRLSLPDPYLLEYKKLKILDKEIRETAKKRDENFKTKAPQLQEELRKNFPNLYDIVETLRQPSCKQGSKMQTSPSTQNDGLKNPFDQLCDNIQSKIRYLQQNATEENKCFLSQIQQTYATIREDWFGVQKNQQLATALGADLTTSTTYLMDPNSNSIPTVQQTKLPPNLGSQKISSQQFYTTTKAHGMTMNQKPQVQHKTEHKVCAATLPLFSNHQSSSIYPYPTQNTSYNMFPQNQHIHPQIRQITSQPLPQKQHPTQNTSYMFPQNQHIHPQIRQITSQPLPQKQQTQSSTRQFYQQNNPYTQVYTNHSSINTLPSCWGLNTIGGFPPQWRR